MAKQVKKLENQPEQIMVDAMLMWRVNTAGFLKEIGSNQAMGFAQIPLQIFTNILIEVGERAAELNDPKLNALMCRMAIYAESDPYSEFYDKDLTIKTIREGYKKV